MIRGYFSKEKFLNDVNGTDYGIKTHWWVDACDGQPVSDSGVVQSSEGFTFKSNPQWETQDPPKEMPR